MSIFDDIKGFLFVFSIKTCFVATQLNHSITCIVATQLNHSITCIVATQLNDSITCIVAIIIIIIISVLEPVFLYRGLGFLTSLPQRRPLHS